MTARKSDTTARQRIADALRNDPATISELSASVGISVLSVYGHLQRVTRTVHGEDGEQFLVAPPECKHCGFAALDGPVNYPSRCPERRSESIEEAVFKTE